MKRVLIISPNFPPVNAPDHQRVRAALPFLEKFGWNADILTLNPKQTNSPLDPWLIKTIPVSTQVHYCSSKSNMFHKITGINSLYFRHRKTLLNKGTELLRMQEYDLVFFSTTQFPFFSFGPLWKKEFNIPFVCDYQDPWITDHYFKNNTPSPPGGWLRYFPNYLLARKMEQSVVINAGGLISVSPSYIHEIKRRYANVNCPMKVLQFGAPYQDLDHLDKGKPSHQSVSLDPSKYEIIYTGRCGENFSSSLKHLFSTITNKKLFEIDDKPIRLNFIGTSYTESQNKYVEQLAKRYGLENNVRELPDRVSYADSLRLMRDGDLTLVLGTNDKTYSASKLHPALMVSNNILLVGFSNTPLLNRAKKLEIQNIISINQDSFETSDNILLNAFHNQSISNLPAEKLRKRISAETVTKKLCHFFDEVVAT